jgi:hypothetical protein
MYLKCIVKLAQNYKIYRGFRQQEGKTFKWGAAFKGCAHNAKDPHFQAKSAAAGAKEGLVLFCETRIDFHHCAASLTCAQLL